MAKSVLGGLVDGEDVLVEDGSEEEGVVVEEVGV